jgi:hypothetical protein
MSSSSPLGAPTFQRFLSQLHLARILERRLRNESTASNSRPYRQWLAAVKCGDYVVATTAPANLALITLTTCTGRRRKANPALCKIFEKQIVASSEKWLRCFHRGRNGKIHWHIVAGLHFSVLQPGVIICPPADLTYKSFGMAGREPDYGKALAEALSNESKSMLKEIRAALRKANLGFIARIEPVHYPDRIVDYVTRYLHGTAQQSRCALDFRVRLWSASKNARVANADCQVLTQWSRIQRLKLAAYFALRRWKSRQEAHDSDEIWQFHARTFLADTKLRVYHYECDYVREWGTRWSPRSSGVRLLYPNLNPDGQPPFCYQYLERPTDAAQLALLQRAWEAALDVPEQVWHLEGA